MQCDLCSTEKKMIRKRSDTEWYYCPECGCERKRIPMKPGIRLVSHILTNLEEYKKLVGADKEKEAMDLLWHISTDMKTIRAEMTNCLGDDKPFVSILDGYRFK